MKNIYVGNLSFRATEDDIRQAFSAYGEVSSVNIVVDRETGRSRGFAFVEMPNADEAAAAVEALHQKEVVGRKITVNEARPREERPPRSGGGGGGGGPRYGGGDRGDYRGGGDRSGGGGGGDYRGGGDRGGDRGGGGGARGGGERGPRRSSYSRDSYDD